MILLPPASGRIGVVWQIAEGGIGVTARTDGTGEPYIGLYPLHPGGAPAGRPVESPRSGLMIRLVAGQSRGREIVVFIEAEVSPRGLHVRVLPGNAAWPDYVERLSARWGDPSPQFPDCAAAANWTEVEGYSLGREKGGSNDERQFSGSEMGEGEVP